LEKTIIISVTRNGPGSVTQGCIEALGCPSIAKFVGMSNLPKARSIAFDEVLKATEGQPIDTVLLLDDDMVFEKQTILRLVELSRLHNECVSAVALSQAGIVAARPHEPLIARVRKRWLTGLSCMAVPLGRLRTAAAELRTIGGVREWCLTGEHPRLPGEWIGEDMWFCLHFDGVELAPLGVGHLKSTAIWPDEATLRQV
jgi:hypothetical protein